MSATFKDALIRAHSFLAELSSWRRYGISFLLGVMTVFALAPYYVLPLLMVGFSGLVWLMDNAARHQRKFRVSFFTGWSFAFGYLYLSLYWMAFSFLHTASGFWHLLALGALGFVGVAGLAGFIALFYGAAVVLAARFWHDGWSRVLVFALCWSLAEYTRGHLLTGLPWNLTGQAFAGTPLLAQAVSLIGPYGLSLVVIILSMLPALTVGRSGRDRDITFAPAGITMGTLALIVAFGATRLGIHPTEYMGNLKLQVVQPNVSQSDKINPAKYSENFMASYNLSGGDALGDLLPEDELYVIWPENAAYAYFQQDTVALDLLEEALPINATLISGAIRIDQDEAGRENYFNSLHVIKDLRVPDAGERELLAELMQDDRQRVIVQSYDKHHLAPFGEYVPFIGLFEVLGIGNLVPLNNSLSRGDGPAVLELGKTTVAPIICYETIFPGRLYPRGQRPDWMVTVTNDAWFGDSVGPKQHLAQARLRAVENGLAMVRSANTGISAVIDPYGRLLEMIPLQQQGTIVSHVPAPAAVTFYARFGDLLYWLLVVGIAAICSRLGARAVEN